MMGYFAPEKKRTSMNWPLKNCCGCIPNPAGMITMGIILILCQLWNWSGRGLEEAYNENLCKESDVMSSWTEVKRFGHVVGTVALITAILVIYLGIVGCKLQGNTTGPNEQGGCCGRDTGVKIGSAGIGCMLLFHFLALISYVVITASYKGIAKAFCCNRLAYSMEESDITFDTDNDIWVVSNDGRVALDSCGFKAKYDEFEGIFPEQDNPFGSAQAEKNVEESLEAKIMMWFGVAYLVSLLLCCGCCTTFVYSATYEVSEAVTGRTGTTTPNIGFVPLRDAATGGTTAVGAV